MADAISDYETAVNEGRDAPQMRILSMIERMEVRHDQQSIHATASLGIARYQKGFASAQDWLQAADKALYHAKESGRNKTTVYQPKAH